MMGESGRKGGRVLGERKVRWLVILQGFGRRQGKQSGF